MEQQTKKEQNPMKGKNEEDSSHSIAEKMALVQLKEKHLQQRLPLEMECEIFQFLKLAIQLKFICGLGRGIYGMFGPKIQALKKTKRLYNSKVNGWDQFKSEQMFVTIFPDELNVLSTNSWLYVIAKKGFAIFGQHCRMYHFPGTILYYYEIIRTSEVAAAHWGFRIGLTDGSSKYVNTGANNSYCIQRASFCYRQGEQLQMAMGDAVGCGLLLSPENNTSIFYTTNGKLMGKTIAISPSADLLFPTISIHRASFEANFGDNPEKPFKFDILNCPELEFE